MFDRALTVALGGLVLVAACGGASRGSRGPGESAPLRSSDAVTLEDLAKVATSSTLYEALHVLRPNWFLRNPSTVRPEKEGAIVGNLDQSRLGGLGSLPTIQVPGLTVVRHSSASEPRPGSGVGHLTCGIQVVRLG